MIFRRIYNRLRQTSPKQLTSRAAYQLWSQDYPPIAHNRLMEIEQDAMLSLMPTLHDRSVLDLGCGTGRYGVIAERDARCVFGIDDSFAMLSRASLTDCVLGSMNRIPLGSDSIDVVICGLAVGHSPDLSGILHEIKRVLVVGGYAIISDFHPQQYMNGARRTFTHHDIVYAVEHHPHLLEHWYKLCAELGLQIEAVLEPMIAGHDVPVVLALRLRKT